MPHAALWVVQHDQSHSVLRHVHRFNAARGFVGGATMNSSLTPVPLIRFQCRTRLCGWCNKLVNKDQVVVAVFQCRTRLCGWCNEGVARGKHLF